MSISRVNSNFLCSSNVRLLLGTRFSSSAKSPSESQIARPPRQSVAYSTGTFLNDTLIAPTQRYDWKQIVRDAEKTVDYPTSFANLRWLLSDKVANVGLQLRKLAASSNLLHRTARKAASQLVNINENYCDSSLIVRHNMQDFGLIVLLLAKAAGRGADLRFDDEELDEKSGILFTQRALAEITEMIRASHLVHQGMVNLQPMSEVGQNFSIHHEIASSNKIVLLSGDYLLGCSCNALAGLRNQDLNELLSATLRDMAESEFIGERDEQNNPLPSLPPKTPRRALTTENVDEEYHRHLNDDVIKPIEKKRFMGSPESEWALRHTLSVGALLGKGCQGVLKLADLPDEMQKNAFWFGKSFALAWQACSDLEPFSNSQLPENTTFSLVSAPVLYHLEYDPDAYEEIKKGQISVENIDFARLHREILKGPAIEKTHKLLKKQTVAALKMLKNFPACESRAHLQNMLLAMQVA